MFPPLLSPSLYYQGMCVGPLSNNRDRFPFVTSRRKGGEARRKDCSVLAVQGGGTGNAMGFVVVLVFLCKRIRDRMKTEEERGGKKEGIYNRQQTSLQYTISPCMGGRSSLIRDTSQVRVFPCLSLFSSSILRRWLRNVERGKQREGDLDQLPFGFSLCFHALLLLSMA